jgi:hypothetical protein
MKLMKNIRYLVRVRDYETVHVEVGAEADHHDLGFTSEEWSQLAPQNRATFTDHLEILLIKEVEKLARHELETIAQWSEISPNLAEDFLSSAPLPTTRSQHARTPKTGTSAASRRLRREPRTTPPAA